MGFFDKSSKRSIDDPDFGRIKEGKAGRWEGTGFQLWGCTNIQVLIDTDPDGPSEEQRSFVRSLRADDGIRETIEQAVASHAKEATSKTGELQLSSIYLPKSPLHQMWRIWFDMEGEEHYSFGAEIEGGHRIVPFSED